MLDVLIGLKEIVKHLLNNTTFMTIFSGVLVYVLSQFVLELIINPHKKYKSLIEEIGYNLALYKCYYHNPIRLFDTKDINDKSNYDIASKDLRKIGSKLAGYIGTISFFKKSKKEKLKNVLKDLISLSNGLYFNSELDNPIQNNTKCEKNIIKLLKLDGIE